jgi:hypothetical protein
MKLRHMFRFIPAGSAARRFEPLADSDDSTVLGRDICTACNGNC